MEIKEKKVNLSGFWALVATQFQAAINDHAFKNLLLLAALHVAVDSHDRHYFSSIIPAIFIAPFILFSMSAGRLADRFSKRTVLLIGKFAEMFLMFFGLIAFSMGGIWPAVGILFLLGIQATYFGPSKYGIIPELVPEKWLSWANGILELTTFAGIILGTFLGALLMGTFGPSSIQILPDIFRNPLIEILAPLFQAFPKTNFLLELIENVRFNFFYPHKLSYGVLALIALSVIGTISAFFITRVPAAAPEKETQLNPLADLKRHIEIARKDSILWLAILGNTYFWFLAGLLFTNIPLFGFEILKLPDVEMGSLMVALAIGIGLGSFLAGYLSGNKIEYGLIPLGATVISLGAIDLAWFVSGFRHSLAALAILGFGGGFFAVPINALIQHRPDHQEKGGIQGVSYMLSNVGVIFASLFYFVTTVYFGLTAPQIFLSGALMTIAATSYAIYILPDFLVRFLLWILTHTFYRIVVAGRDNIPDKGGALFIANHLSFVDALLVIASTDRFVRFIMAREYYELSFIKPGAKLMGVIPISGQGTLRDLLHSLRDAGKAIDDGNVVCIFAEGQMTRTGQLLPFRKGFEKIMKGVKAPIIPVHLDRVWGSIFSFERGKFFWKWPRRLLDPVIVSFGEPMAPESTSSQVRQHVQELAAESFFYRKPEMLPLNQAFIRNARRHPFLFAMADKQNSSVNCLQVLIRSILLAEKLSPTWSGQEMVGIIMPPSVAGACTNLAVLLSGKVPVNINFTTSAESLQSAVNQCGIKTIITSKAFLEKVPLTLPFEPVILEEIGKQITTKDKIKALAKALFMPMKYLERSLGSTRQWKMEDLATIIFSSGSTGDPKGVMLSHYNIFSNLEGLAQVLQVDRNDRIVGILPFFHSLGFTGTLWFPLIKGFGVVYHPSPLDARGVGQITAENSATILLSTPTFLQSYTRRIEPEQFGSLRYVIVGAEKLSEKIAVAFEDKFGIRPLEAYGCTECAPAVTVSIPSFRAPGFFQVGSKRGRIGHPLPGVSVRIVDPESGIELPNGQAGLLKVKGPNIMMGYLNKPEKTAEVLKNGWYSTGDMASVDEDGFVTITDRLSRFAKIAGEMIPLMKVEETLLNMTEASNASFAVTSIPDEKKGEKIRVLHNLDEENLKKLQEKLPSCGLPNLWIPRLEAFFRVDSIPILGSGKVDLRKVKEVALDLDSKMPLNRTA
ncbi:MAG: MFS transporter [Candidatus Riflebacteria bacterium]|nr:MFS transporter [Candidatus Riflebacteria bacterium]